MKTKEQIIKWLDEQPFSNKFYKNVALQGSQLHFTENFIYSAFTWDDTPEGVIFWGKVEKDYINWFNSSSLNEFKFDYSTVKGFPSTVNRSANKLIILNKLFIIRDKIAGDFPRYLIKYFNNDIKVVSSVYVSGGLSFDSLENAKNFLDTFRQELEEVKEYL